MIWFQYECKPIIMIKYLFSMKLQILMDVKEEDISDESKKDHITYYRSLTRLILEIQEEKNQETDPTIKSHLDSRMDAMEKDRSRIKEMFPDISEGEWNGNAD